MPISIDRYVDIASGVVGAQLVRQRELCGLRFTTNPRVPAGSVVTFTDAIAAQALAYFGVTSESTFAAQYAAYVSPPPASRATTLRFAAFVSVARMPQIYGGKVTADLATFKAITAGNLTLTMGAITKVIAGVTFAAATSLADVASTLQTAIRAADASAQWAQAVVVFDPSRTEFLLSGGTAGAGAIAIGAALTGDMGAALGWRAPLAVFSPGAEAQSPLEALQAAEQVTDSFGSLSFDDATPPTLDEAEQLAVYVAALNVKYQFYYTVSLATASQASDRLSQYASVGLILNGIVGEYKESLPAAIGAALDFSRTNCVVNFMYRQGPFQNENDVSENTTADGLDANRVNYYGTTATAGQKLAFFQRGYLLGGATAPVDMNVHFNEQWFKSALQADLLNGQLSLSQIGANDQGRGTVLGLVQGRINQAKRNGVISVGKNLTQAQQLAVTEITGDIDAWRDVQTNGYWADVVIQDYVGESGVTEYKAVYTIVYSKNDVVRKIEGSHNLV